MKRFLVLLTVAATASLAPCFHAGAVSPGELEKARTEAAIVYLRNVNPSSDYLNDVDASTRTELAGKLKDTEKKNLKKFNASLPSASGSESWGKEELIEYAKKAVVAPGGYESTGYASKMVAVRIGRMKIAPPTAAATPEATAPQQPEEQPTPAPAADSTTTASLPEPFEQGTNIAAAQDSALRAAQDSLTAAEEKLQQSKQNEGNSSMFYIIILCVLVLLVIALVVYAARYFNRQNNDADRGDSKPARRPDSDYQPRPQEPAPTTPQRPSAQLSDDERDQVIASLRTENEQLRKTVEEYKYHLNYLKAEREKREQQRLQEQATAARQPHYPERPAVITPQPTLGDRYQTPESATLNDRYADNTANRYDTAYNREPNTPAPESDSRITGKSHRTIYLGRANREGMFIRAERNLNPQHSLFRLSTTDNLTGYFTVAEDEEVGNRILANPELLLAISCDTNGSDTYGKEAVVTVEPGIAVFQGGRWRVKQPALVKFV